MDLTTVLGAMMLRMQKRAGTGFGTQIGGATGLKNDLAKPSGGGGGGAGSGFLSDAGKIKPIGDKTPLTGGTPTFNPSTKLPAGKTKGDVVGLNPNDGTGHQPHYGLAAMDDPAGGGNSGGNAAPSWSNPTNPNHSYFTSASGGGSKQPPAGPMKDDVVGLNHDDGTGHQPRYGLAGMDDPAGASKPPAAGATGVTGATAPSMGNGGTFNASSNRPAGPMKDDVVGLNPNDGHGNQPRYGLAGMDNPAGSTQPAPTQNNTPAPSTPAPTGATPAPGAAPGTDILSMLTSRPQRNQQAYNDEEDQEAREQAAIARKRGAGGATTPTKVNIPGGTSTGNAPGYTKDANGFDIPGSNRPGWKPPTPKMNIPDVSSGAQPAPAQSAAPRNSPVQITNRSMYSGETTSPMLSIQGNVSPPKDMFRGRNLNAAINSTFQDGNQQNGAVNVSPRDLGSRQRMFKSSAFQLGFQLAMRKNASSTRS